MVLMGGTGHVVLYEAWIRAEIELDNECSG